MFAVPAWKRFRLHSIMEFCLMGEQLREFGTCYIIHSAVVP